MANPGHASSKAGNRSSPPTADPPGLAAPSRTTRSRNIDISNIIENPTEEIRDAESARKFLDTTQFCIQGEAMTPEHLAHTLFYISQKASTPTLRSLIRATAFLTTDLAASTIISSIQSKLSLHSTHSDDSPTQTQREEIKIITDKLENAIDQWSTQQVNMKKTLDKVPQIDDPTDLLLMDSRIQSISESIASIQTTLETIKLQPTATPTHQNPQPHSFRDVVANDQRPIAPMARAKPQGTDQARGRSAIKQRQLLMDPDSDHPLIKPETTIDTLVKIFQKALDSMKTDSAPPPETSLNLQTAQPRNSSGTYRSRGSDLVKKPH